MRKHKRKSREPKGIYRVRNWSEYNAGLIARGSLTMWIDESAFMSGSEASEAHRVCDNYFKTNIKAVTIELNDLIGTRRRRRGDLIVDAREPLKVSGASRMRGHAEIAQHLCLETPREYSERLVCDVEGIIGRGQSGGPALPQEFDVNSGQPA